MIVSIRLQRALVFAVLVAAAVPTRAQQPTPPATTPPATAAKPQPEAPAKPPYTYEREGRRDPFVSLIGRGTETPGSNRPAGLGGMLINEVNLKGIVRSGAGYVAFLQGPDKKTYTVRPGQKLLDGSIKQITPDTVVFSQDVNDPLSLVKQREVRKTLRTSEEGRG